MLTTSSENLKSMRLSWSTERTHVNQDILLGRVEIWVPLRTSSSGVRGRWCCHLWMNRVFAKHIQLMDEWLSEFLTPLLHSTVDIAVNCHLDCDKVEISRNKMDTMFIIVSREHNKTSRIKPVKGRQDAFDQTPHSRLPRLDEVVMTTSFLATLM